MPRAGSPADRGYGQQHRKIRDSYRALVASGGALCARCMLPIDPSDAWDLGHDDQDRTLYSGPEHARCNRHAGARNGGRVTARKRRVKAWSRQWLDD